MELKRFRQLVVNMILATDIFDKDMIVMREQRWDKAFHQYNDGDGAARADTMLDMEDKANQSSLSVATTGLNKVINLKATVVIEHLMLASDVAHMMQHWHVFAKWNEQLFHEMYKAYTSGRACTDPSLNWYQGELGFFDFYIIPLAKKLKECGVFGVASDEYLNYAEANRREWKLKGKEIVRNYLMKCKAPAEDSSLSSQP